MSLLEAKLSGVPNRVPIILCSADFQRAVLLNLLGDYHLYNVLKHSEEGTCLLLKDPELEALKQS
jgi:hypothetical protein